MVEPAVLVELWQPFDVGGSNVVMPCRFSEAHANMLRAEAENQRRPSAKVLGRTPLTGLPTRLELSKSWTCEPRLTY